jgi:outer membrane receptor protein involved in Fe transport
MFTTKAKSLSNRFLRASLLVFIQCAIHANSALAQQVASAPEPAGLEEIVVTAQKRSQNINDVPMTITALSEAALVQNGVSSVGDLAKVVPGFQYTNTFLDTPVYTLRGVGFYDNSISARPSVSTYVDEINLPFGVVTPGALLDVERVEVLKGPQGTLYGQNSTGGAINFVSATPTNTFSAGGDLTFGRFKQGEVSGFVNGPLSDTVNVRVAAKEDFGGDWQRSYTRDDGLGRLNNTFGRILVDWHPADKLTFLLNLNGWRENSDTRAGQLIKLLPQNPTGIPTPRLANYPLAPLNDRAADWTPEGYLGNHRPNQDSKFWQTALRGDYKFTDAITLTSLTSYLQYRSSSYVDADGTDVYNLHYHINGTVKTFSQELRLSGDNGALKWLGGLYYQTDKTTEHQDYRYLENSNNAIAPDLAGSSAIADINYKTKAAFANIDYNLLGNVVLHAGARYTKYTGDTHTCNADGLVDHGLGNFLQGIYNFFRAGEGLPPITIPPGGCISVNDNFTPGFADLKLTEHNISWRTGLDWKPSQSTLLYVSVAKGYKGGSFPLLAATQNFQYVAAKQESVLAYEVGFKTTLLNGYLQLNGAGFYDNYDNKQFEGRALTNPNIFGALETLLNVPKSRIYGAELQIIAEPVRGLTMSGGATYLRTAILDNFTNYDSFGNLKDFGGEAFPYTPTWQATADIVYKWDVGNNLNAFVGSTGRYQTSTNAAFGEYALFGIDSFGTLDLRAGIESPGGGWRVSVWGRNVTDKYYWNNAVRASDTVIRYAGDPATFGISASFRTH